MPSQIFDFFLLTLVFLITLVFCTYEVFKNTTLFDKATYQKSFTLVLGSLLEALTLPFCLAAIGVWLPANLIWYLDERKHPQPVESLVDYDGEKLIDLLLPQEQQTPEDSLIDQDYQDYYDGMGE
jgi:hypothetical protein